MKPTVLVPIACVALLFTASICRGNGYKIVCVKSAKATGLGEAFVAQADDPTAVTFNPAGLAQLRGNQVNLHATFCRAYTKHEAPGGERTTSDKIVNTIPSFFATTDAGGNDLAFGLGISFPNAFATKWDHRSFARYVATRSDFQVMDISPAAGMKIGDSCCLGVALNILSAEAELDRRVDAGLVSGAPGAADIPMTLDGNGTAVGGQVGVIWHLSNRQRVAATYRLPVTVDMDGDLVLGPASQDIEASIDLPATVVLGYAFTLSRRWHVEIDLDWTDWEQVGDIAVEPKTPGMPPTLLEQDLKNTLIYKCGAEFTASKHLRLRAGYMYDESATRERTWRPSLPDTDVHFLNIGVGYDLGAVTLDAALQGVFYEKVRIDNNVDANETLSSSSIDGTYRTIAPSVTLGLTYRF